jgi:hypothetical protein
MSPDRAYGAARTAATRRIGHLGSKQFLEKSGERVSV